MDSTLSGAGCWSGAAIAGAASTRGPEAAGACSRTMRIRVPGPSTSSSARLWRTASSTTWSMLRGAGSAGPRADRRLATLTRRRHAAEVLAAARIDLHHVAFVEEERHLDHRAGLEGGGLGAAGGGVAADAGIRLGDCSSMKFGSSTVTGLAR